jgi:hypothetical protein
MCDNCKNPCPKCKQDELDAIAYKARMDKMMQDISDFAESGKLEEWVAENIPPYDENKDPIVIAIKKFAKEIEEKIQDRIRSGLNIRGSNMISQMIIHKMKKDGWMPPEEY